MSQLLRNDHNVYILGAGFSRQAGLPLIADFMSQMRDTFDWLSGEKREREAGAIEEVLKFRLEAASAAFWVNLDLENIEELFSLASASAENISKSMRLAIGATLDYALKNKGTLRCKLSVMSDGRLFSTKSGSCPHWAKLVSSGNAQPINSSLFEVGVYSLHVARLLGMLQDGKPQGENTFITINYDTLLEDALDELGLTLRYGSRIPNPTRTHRPIFDGIIPVLKLHGSVNWAREGSDSNLIKVFKNCQEIAESNLVPELIPPTWKKVFENEIESVWEEAVAQLNTATRIVIIGFSMRPTDMHFKYLLAAGLKKNISLRQVLFVNPDPNKELESRVKGMLRSAYVESGRISFARQELATFTGLQPFNGMRLDQLGRPTEFGLTYNLF